MILGDPHKSIIAVFLNCIYKVVPKINSSVLFGEDHLILLAITTNSLTLQAGQLDTSHLQSLFSLKNEFFFKKAEFGILSFY